MDSQQTLRTFKIAVVGATGVGKTSFIRKVATGEFSSTLCPEEKQHVFSLNSTDNGMIEFELLDVGSSEICDNNQGSRLVGVDGAIVMFSQDRSLRGTSSTVDHIDNWIQSLKKRTGDIPFVVVWNKVDLNISTSAACFDKLKYETIDVSVFANHHLEKPFELLARALAKKNCPVKAEVPLMCEWCDQSAELFHLRALLKIRDDETTKLRAKLAKLEYAAKADFEVEVSRFETMIKSRDEQITNLSAETKKYQDISDVHKVALGQLNGLVTDAWEAINGLKEKMAKSL
eukprot:GILJ01015911.1.p1 GENE.GILJ01015911.1~~GILJ01015911.1.p1  ORF type:complete len:288 (+),score=44.37 GILJ01015911.1:43-906(+)